MKLNRLILALLAILSAHASASAGDVDKVSLGEQFAARNCAWCHGAAAQGFATAPQLAGQKPEYIVSQLQGFYNHLRDNPFSELYMWGVAARLNPETATELAAYLSLLPPKPAEDGNEELIVTGRQVYEFGIPDQNIVACVACHGPNAVGIRQIPRLGGLSYHYLRRRLKQWGEGYHASATPMPEIASSLSPELVDALASYLSFVK